MFPVSHTSVPMQCFVLFSFIIFHSSFGQNEKYLTSFVDFLKRLPDQPYVYEDGILLNAQKEEQNRYKIEASLKASDLNNPKAFKLLKCSGVVHDDDGTITVQDGHECHEELRQFRTDDVHESTTFDPVEETPTDGTVGEQPIKLDNEVQDNTAQVTSGEQFVAIPRPQSPGRPCVGCSTLVDPAAAGVRELALLAVRHLHRHEPSARHTLGAVLEVERQVQVVNGVRYILTLNVDFNNCTPPDTQADGCSGSKVCKMSILEKPWIKLPDGSKLRAILANNCTDEWLYGDEGEVLSDNEERNDVDDESTKDNDKSDKQTDDSIIKINAPNVQSVPNQQRTLSEDDIKNIEEQIISNDQVTRKAIQDSESKPQSADSNQETAIKIVDTESKKESIESSDNNKHDFPNEDATAPINLSDDKKKAIDDLENLFEDSNSLVKRHSPDVKDGFVDLEQEKNTDDTKYKPLGKESLKYESSRKEKRGVMTGGVKETDPNNPKYQQLAKESLAKYVQETGATEPFEVVKVVKTSEQLVAGTLTRVDFIASPVGSSVTITCHSEILERVWLKEKDINVKCEAASKSKRQAKPGGVSDGDPTDPLYQNLAYESLAKYAQDTGDTRPYKVLEVIKVSGQLVAGTLTNLDFTALPEGSEVILLCHSEIWERVWLNKKEINVKCGLPSRRKRGFKTGGISDTDPNDPKYQELAKESLAKYVQDTGATEPYEVVKVVKSSEQVVAGSLTRVDFIASPVGSSVTILCHSKIWNRPWLNKKEINVECEAASRSKRQAKPGGVSDGDPTDPLYQKLAQASLAKYAQDTGDSQPYKVLEVIKVSGQLVAGTLTNLDFTALPEGSEVILLCHSEIWERVWLNKKEINVKCGLPSRKKRGAITGGISETDPNDPRYRKLAEESLAKYVQETGATEPYEVVKVVKSSEQLVAGTLTRVDFIASQVGSSSTVLCHSKIWSRSWLNKTETNVTCEATSRKKRSIEIEESKNSFDHESLSKQDRPLRKLNLYEINLDSERADMASQLANEALKHIEAKYRHPLRMKVVKIRNLDKQLVAGIHYRMKLEVGFTNCLALSVNEEDCTVTSDSGRKFCRANVWIRPWTDHPPSFRVFCESNDTSQDMLHHETQAEHLFYDFLATYKPSYVNNGDEMKRRFQIFKHNVDRIHELNTHERGTARYAVTKFTDMDYEEFKKKFLGLRPELRREELVTKVAEIPKGDVPDSFDWRDHGAVTDVKNQGQCGSCWAFSVTGNVEGQWKLKTGKLVSLSEQELVDCDKLDDGCNGGLPDNAYRAIEQLGGLETESDYPYDAQDDKCSFNKTMAKVTISGAVNISSDEVAMAKWLAKNGPISIGINANAMQFYVGGVSHPWRMLCSPKKIDHGVLIVGYGEKDYPLFHKKMPYWTIKNSWGPEWGEQGYYRVYRGDGTCGVNQMASSSIID